MEVNDGVTQSVKDPPIWLVLGVDKRETDPIEAIWLCESIVNGLIGLE